VSFRREHSKLRPQPPRLKDQKRRERPGEPNRNQDSKGRFTAGNDAPKGRAVKRIIRRYLGEGAASSGQVEALTQDTLTLFKAFKRVLGNDAPQVQDTVARRARWGVLSAWYALHAAELGLGTEQGMAALEMALKLDARAERLDVTALDLAERLVSKEAPDPHAFAAATFSRPAPVVITAPAQPTQPNGSNEGGKEPTGGS
jgi:hypothetical protein